MQTNKFKLSLFRQIPTAVEHVLNLLCLYNSVSFCTEQVKNHSKIFMKFDIIQCSDGSVKQNKVIFFMHASNKKKLQVVIRNIFYIFYGFFKS